LFVARAASIFHGFIATKRHKKHKRDKKTAKKVLYKDINNWVPAPCLRLAGAGYNMQGIGQAAEDRRQRA